MKKNPGRKERRNLYFKNKRAAGKRNEYASSHRFLRCFQE